MPREVSPRSARGPLQGVVPAPCSSSPRGCAAASGLAALIPVPSGAGFYGMMDAGAYARFFCVLIGGITLLSLCFAYPYAQDRGFSRDEFYGCVLFAALGMMLVASALHWVIFFLGLELLSISLYVIIAARKGDPGSNEAALKYFIAGSVASGFLTFGIAVLYAATGQMDIARSLGAGLSTGNDAGMLLALGLILVGIGFKVSLVPFHLWTPDVYQGAPAPVTAFLSTGSKVALFSALLRFAMNAGDGAWSHLAPVLWVLAALTMVVGNVCALSQDHVKRLLAYSSIAQMGYMLMALLAVKQNGASAIMFYAAVYALMDLGAFGTIGMLSREASDLDFIHDYRGKGYAHPWNGALLGLCLFSLAGLPPTGGFIGKFVLFRATLQAGYLWLAIVGILSAIISIFFYLKVLTALYMNPESPGTATAATGFQGNMVTAFVMALILFLGILPTPLFYGDRADSRRAHLGHRRGSGDGLGEDVRDRVNPVHPVKKRESSAGYEDMSEKTMGCAALHPSYGSFMEPK